MSVKLVGLFGHKSGLIVNVQDRGSATCYVCLIILLALLPTLALAAPPLAPREARQSPTVRIEPAVSVVGAGRTFTVSVTIEEADDLGGFEFTLLFHPATATVDSVTLGDFPGSTGREVIPAVGPAIDNDAGKASLGVVTVGSASGPSGTGVLAAVTFTAQSRGESPLDLQDVLVVDTHAEQKTPTVENGMVRVGLAVYLPLILKDWHK